MKVSIKMFVNYSKRLKRGSLNHIPPQLFFLELNYVTRKIYKLPIEEVLDYIEAVRKMRGMTVIEKTDADKAITLYKKHKIKLGDCFIAAQIPKGAVLATYDEDFKKIKEIQSQTPDEILQ